MNADGSDLRLLTAGDLGAWSPDGSQIALGRYFASGTSQALDTSVIAIVDVRSGSEHVLEATSVGRKTEGTPTADTNRFVTIESLTFRSWFYEGWSWSPDGRSLLLLERHGTRPVLIDVDTGRATELPWESDSAPSW